MTRKFKAVPKSVVSESRLMIPCGGSRELAEEFARIMNSDNGKAKTPAWGFYPRATMGWCVVEVFE